MDQLVIPISKTMSVKCYNTVHVFDMDGTILDSLHLWQEPVFNCVFHNVETKLIKHLLKCCEYANINVWDLMYKTCNNYVELSINKMKTELITKSDDHAKSLGMVDNETLVNINQFIIDTLDALQYHIFDTLEKNYDMLRINENALAYMYYCKNVLKHKVVLATLNNKNNLGVVMKNHPELFTMDNCLFDLVIHREMFDTADNMYDKNEMLSHIITQLDSHPNLTILYDDTDSVLSAVPKEIGRVKISSLKNDWQALINKVSATYEIINNKASKQQGVSSAFVRMLTEPEAIKNNKPSRIGDNVMLMKYSEFPKISVVYTDKTVKTLEG